jgi:hypothetical protein
MVLQGIIPMEHTTSYFVAFCDLHEFTEGTLDNSNDPKHEAKPKASLKNSSNDAQSQAKPSEEATKYNYKRSASTDKWCDIHQTSGHYTSVYKVVQFHTAKISSNWEPVHAKSNSQISSNFTVAKKQ